MAYCMASAASSMPSRRDAAERSVNCGCFLGAGEPIAPRRHSVRRTGRIGITEIDRARNREQFIAIGKVVAVGTGPFRQYRLERVLGRRDQLRVAEEVDAAFEPDFAMGFSSGGLQHAVAPEQETIALPVVAQSVRFADITGIGAVVHVVRGIERALEADAIKTLG